MVAARIFPADRYVIHITQDQTVQRVGFAIRRGLNFTANPDLVDFLNCYHPEVGPVPGSLQLHFLDALYRLSLDDLRQRLRLEA